MAMSFPPTDSPSESGSDSASDCADAPTDASASYVPPVRRTTMAHVDGAAIRYFETMNDAQKLYMNSMRIALDPVASSASAGGSGTGATVDALEVALRIDVSNWTSAQHTLSVCVSADCVKRFVFKPGEEAPGIPISANRPTRVDIRCYNNGEEISSSEGRSFLLNMPESHSTALCQPVTISGSADTYRFYTALRRKENAFSWTFPCYTYAGDVCADSSLASTGYSMSNAMRDFRALLESPVITPSRDVAVVDCTTAEERLQAFEQGLVQVQATFHSVCVETAKQELCAADDNPEDIMKRIDWESSYVSSPDAAVQALIASTKQCYTKLTELSNTAVDNRWLTHTAVLELLEKRKYLAESVKARRLELSSVARVRSTFVCIDAIDNMLRHVCSVGTQDTTLSNMDTVMEIPCHRYWLEQARANTQNSVMLHPEAFQEAVEIIDKCADARGGRKLLPLPLAAVHSSIGRALWKSMHLQGLAVTHALPVAPCANFMYKQRARVDYKTHPVVAGAAAPSVPLALLTMLVSVDVEHRIIPPKLCAHILNLLQQATAVSPREDAVQEASAFLTRVLDNQLHSLANAALCQDAVCDLSFITKAGRVKATTGYNMKEVSAFCLQDVMRQVHDSTL